VLPKFNVLTAEQVNQVHEQSIKILEEIGVEFSYQPALRYSRPMDRR
jgi:trimethylamine--corrinoid protein Co-methyltransferase